MTAGRREDVRLSFSLSFGVDRRSARRGAERGGCSLDAAHCSRWLAIEKFDKNNTAIVQNRGVARA